VQGLLAQAVVAADLGIPELVSQQLKQAARAVRLQSLAATGEVIRIGETLARESIPYRFLKGIPLAVLAYGTASVKQSIDIDLLVRPVDVVSAAAALSQLGYGPRTPPRPLTPLEFERWSSTNKEAQLLSERAALDLHWAINDQPMLLSRLDPFADARSVVLIGNRAVDTLEDAANLAYLSVHGAMHGWSRLKWLADFNAFIAARPPLEREKLCARASELNPGRALDQALLLSARLLGAAPAAPRSRDPIVEQLAALAITAIENRRLDRLIEYDKAAWSKVQRSQLLLHEGIRYRLSEFGRRRREREVRLRLRLPLPRALQWLYLPLRMPGAIAGRIWRTFKPLD
jgi:hypothetical protein